MDVLDEAIVGAAQLGASTISLAGDIAGEAIIGTAEVIDDVARGRRPPARLLLVILLVVLAAIGVKAILDRRQRDEQPSVDVA